MEIKIFTDGSSRGNPGPGGFGAIVADEKKVTELGGREENTTNNRMELTAAIGALNFIKIKLSTINHQLLTIYSDSKYVINGITKWVFDWQKNGWKTKAKKPVENQDLWMRLLELSKSFDIKWVHVEGHVGHNANERCDEIATSFADGNNPKLYSGLLKSYPINLSLSSPKLIANNYKLKTSKKAYSYLSMVGDVIQKHKTWLECEKKVKGVSGARWKKSVSKEDEEQILSEWKKQF